jgi:hypothetical protein
MATPAHPSSSTWTWKADGQGFQGWQAALALFGSLNLLLGLTLALRQPFRASDLWKMYGWCHRWLYAGEHLYGSPPAPDYPPNAIITYGLLATIPARWIVVLWAIFILALTPLLPYAVLRSASRRARISSAIVPTLLFVCWGGPRVVLQFSQLSFLLAFIALAIPAHRIVAGVCLGLALAKPHIAGPMALWAACTRRYRIALVAAAFVGLELGIYCLRAGVTPLQAIADWGLALRETYMSTNALNGYTSLRPWVVALIGDRPAADAVWIGTSLMALIPLCLAARRDRTETLAIPSLLCLWSLLTIYHHLNNLILMLPAFIFLLTIDDPGTRTRRAWAVGIVQMALMLDIPVRLRGVADGSLGMVVANVDRVVVLATLLVVLWQWRRLQRDARPAGSRGLLAPRSDLPGAKKEPMTVQQR